MGASGVFVGYRDNEHVLRQTEFIPTNEILGRIEAPWNPEVSINKLFQLLYVLRQRCQDVMDQREIEHDHRRLNIIWKLAFREGKPLIWELSEKEKRKLYATKAQPPAPQTLHERVGVLPLLFLENMQEYAITKALEP